MMNNGVKAYWRLLPPRASQAVPKANIRRKVNKASRLQTIVLMNKLAFMVFVDENVLYYLREPPRRSSVERKIGRNHRVHESDPRVGSTRQEKNFGASNE